MNISDPTAIRECTACQMCAAVCPATAISIKLNEDGFYRPYVDEHACTDCSLCTKVCYKFDTDVATTTGHELQEIEVHSAQLKSQDILRQVTSGGVADALAKELVSQGYVCIGVTYNDDNHRAEHRVASTPDETDAFRGSKYIQSYSVDAFRTLVKTARQTKFAVFGLPCHIYAAHKILTKRSLRDNYILIDLFCHGCPSMLVWNKYEGRIKRELGGKRFDDVQFRSKAKGWGAFHVAVKVDGKEAFVSSPSRDEFYTLFFSDQVLNDGCSDCILRSSMAYTDIRLGDFWGKRFLGDRKGVSAVAIVSERGRDLFNSIKDQIVTSDSSMGEVLVKQSYGKKYHVNGALRRRMLDSLRDDNQPLKQAVAIYESSCGMAYKAKKILKRIDWYLPFDLVRFLKRIR